MWWLGSYGNGIFVPLRDATAGTTTYGAGRYLLDTVKGADLGREGDAWVVDLNFSYNPSCAYDPDWACPLAPAGNRLEAAVPVGELTPATDWLRRSRASPPLVEEVARERLSHRPRWLRRPAQGRLETTPPHRPPLVEEARWTVSKPRPAPRRTPRTR